MSFYDEVYKLCKKIPKGRVSSYKILAEKLGTKAYRAVGQALRNNPDAPRIPCHRIVDSKGYLHGFGGGTNESKLKEKRMLLEKEGVKVRDNKVVDFEKKLHRFGNIKD